MEFEVSKPTHDSVNKYYKLQIISPPVFHCEGRQFDSSGTYFTGENYFKLDIFVSRFLEKASSYFSKALDKELFLKRLSHKYSTGEHDILGATIKEMTWTPVHVLFYLTQYEIHWRLMGFETVKSPPGALLEETDVQEISKEEPPRHMLSSDSIQKRVRKKIRKARIRCGYAKLHLERLIDKYYTKYGRLDGLSKEDSELSSEEE